MTYVDGFVAAVPTANREKFKKHADEAAAIFKEYGALSVVESGETTYPRAPQTGASRSSACPRMRWRASARRPLPEVATSSMPNRSNSRVWLRAFGAYSRPTNSFPTALVRMARH